MAVKTILRDLDGVLARRNMLAVPSMEFLLT